MKNSIIWLLLLVTTVLSARQRKREGDSCTLENGQPGICKKFSNCPSAQKAFAANKWSLQRCGNRPTPVCCEDSNVTDTTSSTTTMTTTTTTTTSTTTITTSYPSITTQEPKIEYGQKSKQKCQDYSKWNFAPTLFLDSEPKQGLCGISLEPTILGGEKAKPLEFPHMAKLRYSDPDKLCGASLISNRFLMTAAHCLLGTEGPTEAILGTGDTKSQRLVKIAERISHPLYTPPFHYHDIALLRLERPLAGFSDYMRPACIDTEKEFINATEAYVTGWGKTEHMGDLSDYLQKASLPIVNHTDCRQKYPVYVKLQRGVDEKSMFCAGGADLNKDTCQGDSGGPLQIALKKPSCMYSIIGITSFGRPCGSAPGVYTRVSNYIPWIESVVWPEGGERGGDNEKNKFYLWY